MRLELEQLKPSRPHLYLQIHGKHASIFLRECRLPQSCAPQQMVIVKNVIEMNLEAWGYNFHVCVCVMLSKVSVWKLR